ncbi:inositol-tetrakisphosphate 1-kinase-like isoform X2 [Ylistrum balloti]|uniref:inositol-tetrakisphosphate 1-kinase-like isoform X2 n=1 Tax=Ylistrum balloti TaxID=509963 RepID=UPI00290593AD|nr:inositol-tetrakisphosphate 1-kinase-like isoform X2 [Ylistrum balloti]
MKRVGYWISEKKAKSLNLEDQKEVFRNAGIELIKLDIHLPLEEQGPFDLILHKFTGLMVKAEEGDTSSHTVLQNVKDYLRRHPSCLLVDTFDSLKNLIDRNEQYKLLLRCHLLDSVCKPIVAHSTSRSHKMCIIFNEEGLKDVQPPCVAQTFINHNAILYKVFVIGDKQYVTERPSLKNFYNEDQETIYFDSSQISKPNCSNALTELDEGDPNKSESPVKPDIELLKELGQVVGLEFQIQLFGIDVIIDCVTKKYAVIDINAFPGYEGVDGFVQLLCNHLMSLMNQQPGNQSSDRSLAGTKHNGHHLPLENGYCDRPKRLKYSSPEPEEHTGVCSKCCDNSFSSGGNKTVHMRQAKNLSDDLSVQVDNRAKSDVIPWKQPINGCVEHSH